jgi:hypothetical protein
MPATMKRRPQTQKRSRRVGQQIVRRADPTKAPNSLNQESRTVRAVIATNEPVRVRDWQNDRWIDEVLIPTGMTAPARMRLRIDHNTYRSLDVIGSVFDFSMSDNEVEATLRFSRAADVELIYQRVVDGDLNAVSIGATYSMRDTIELQPGKSKRIAGVNYTAREVPMLLVERWTPSETSVVDEGADPRAVIRSKRKVGTVTKRSSQSSEPTAEDSESVTEEQTTMPVKFKKKPAAAAASTQRRAKKSAPQSNRSVKTRRSAAPEDEDPVDDLADDEDGDVATLTDDDDSDDDDTDTDEAPTSRRSKGETNRVSELLDVMLDRLATKRAKDSGRASDVDAIAVARREERQRVARIRELGQGQPERLIARAIEEGWTEEQFGLKVLERLQRQSTAAPTRQSGDGVNRAPAVHSARGATVEALQAGLLARSGVNVQNPIFATDVGATILRRNNLGWLVDLNRDIADGGNSEREQIVDIGRRFASDSAARTCERLLEITSKRGVPHDVEEIVQRSFSNPYLPRVFGAIISVGLVSGFASYTDSTIGWVDEADWRDFRDNQPIGLDGSQGLRKHTRGSQAKDIDFNDFGEKYAVARYSGRFVLDDMDIIDDVVGMNQTLPFEMGQMAARLRPDLVYATLQANAALADGTALFHSSRGNVVTGQGVLSIDSLSNAEAAMAIQKVLTKSGGTRPMNLTAGWLIVPRARRGKGKQIVNSVAVVTGSTTQQGNVNPHDGEWVLRSDARLDLGVTDPRNDIATTGSGTVEYIAERTGKRTLQVGYRIGTGRAPKITVKNLMGVGEFGIGWDIYHDIGCGVLSPAGLVRITE